MISKSLRIKPYGFHLLSKNWNHCFWIPISFLLVLCISKSPVCTISINFSWSDGWRESWVTRVIIIILSYVISNDHWLGGWNSNVQIILIWGNSLVLFQRLKVISIVEIIPIIKSNIEISDFDAWVAVSFNLIVINYHILTKVQ